METKDIALLIGCLLPVAACIYTDAKTYILPNWLTASVIISGLTAAVFMGRIPDALLGALLAGGVFLFACLSGGAGGGDFKLATGIGIWFGFYGGATVVIAGCLAGVVYGMVRMAQEGVLKKWLKAMGIGLYLRFSGVKGAVPMGKLPEDDKLPVPANVVPFGTFLGGAVWIYSLVGMQDVISISVSLLSGVLVIVVTHLITHAEGV